MFSEEEKRQARCQRGRCIYETKLRAALDTPENYGKVLTIEVDSEDYEVSARLAPAIDLLRARHPDKILYSMRIGEGASARVRGGRRLRK